MQTSASLTDRKLSILFDKYRDRDFANNAQKEVEDIRRRALKVGAITTGSAFVLNEFARLTMRSRKWPWKESLFELINPNILLF